MALEVKKLSASFIFFYYLVLIAGTINLLALMDQGARHSEIRSHPIFLFFSIMSILTVSAGWILPGRVSSGKVSKKQLLILLWGSVALLLVQEIIGLLHALMVIG